MRNMAIFINNFSFGRRTATASGIILKQAGLGAEVYDPGPLHLQECFRSMGHRKGDLPKAERASQNTLALPIDPGLTFFRRMRSSRRSRILF
jgi:dTDP-4-amino-4,6-dideoxygalactose transaminase